MKNKILFLIFSFILFLSCNLFAKVVDKNKTGSISDRIVELSKKYKYLGLGQNSHESKTFNQILIDAIPALVKDANVRYIICEFPRDWQFLLDEYMKTGDDKILYKLFFMEYEKYHGNHYGNIELFQYIYKFNKGSSEKLNVICAEFPYFYYYDKNGDGMFSTQELGSANNVGKFMYMRDLSAFEKIKELTKLANKKEHFIIWYGNFHMALKMPFSERSKILGGSVYYTKKHKTLAEYLKNEYKYDFYSVNIGNICSISSEKSKVFSDAEYYNAFFKLPSERIKPTKYSVIKSVYFDEEIIYYDWHYYGLNTYFIKTNTMLDLLIKNLGYAKGKILKFKSAEDDPQYNTLKYLAFFTGTEKKFFTYKDAQAYYSKWLKKNIGKIKEDDKDAILKKEYIFNLKATIVLAHGYIYKSNRNISEKDQKFIDEILEKIIKLKIKKDTIGKKELNEIMDKEYKILCISSNYGFRNFDEGYFRFLIPYLKKNGLKVDKMERKYNWICDNFKYNIYNK